MDKGTKKGIIVIVLLIGMIIAISSQMGLKGDVRDKDNFDFKG
tara:strand:+ start:290 stop:418 length:129 start_codon:yes stop_codon:yes gene_type:complete